jgi:cytochrome subunit of sulfide dehydrogenase
MKLQHRCLLAAFALTMGGASGVSAESANGRDIAANCAACHGTSGRARGAMPALAGRPKDDIVSKVGEFRDGKRASTVMQQLARGYSDAQIEAAAAYFAAQTPN